jgi:hypothetical protein
MLLAMIKEIDKICPEEGMVYDSTNTQMHDASRGQIQEYVVSLLSSGPTVRGPPHEA